MKQEEYLQNRVEDQISWYDKKSRSNQMWFKSLRLIEIVSAAIIPFVAGMGDYASIGTIIIGILGVIIAISVGLSVLNKYQENWFIYRTTCEILRQEKFLFLTKTKPYNNEQAFNQFVERIENLISKGNTQWARVSKSKTQAK